MYIYLLLRSVSKIVSESKCWMRPAGSVQQLPNPTLTMYFCGFSGLFHDVLIHRHAKLVHKPSKKQWTF
jgi:hypothetical protein